MRLRAHLLLSLLAACTSPAPSVSLPVGADADPQALPRYTPRWAFEPWISKDISTGSDTYAFVDGFIARDIPVGVVVLDSPWETNYNSFVPNPSRYPEFPKLVTDMRGRGVRVVLWVTQMVNQTSFDLEVGGDQYTGPSPNWAEGKRNGYFVNGGKLYTWWKGQGAGVDFFNPAAVTWWRAQQDALLAQGVSGWKLDFGEDYITDQPLSTAAGPKTLQEYSEAYYRDFLVHGLKRRGREEFVTMVRPYDKSYVFFGRFYARPEHAPVAWVGDNRRDWVGLKDALDHLFRSARAGYVVVGSDIGGYLDFDDVDMSVRVPFSQATFARWVAVGAMTPFMQLHGRGNLTPWTVPERPEETVELYRYWSKLHHQLVPFFFSTAQAAYAGGPVPLQPVGDEAQWTDDYRFVLGDAFLVAPILDDTGVRDVPLPAGSRWVDWWTGAAHDGGATLTAVDATDRRRLPLYVREGALVPATVEDDATGLGTAASKGALTVLAWPGPQPSRFTVHHDDGATLELTAARLAQAVTVGLSRAPGGAVLRVWTGGRSVQSVSAGEVVPRRSSRAEFDASTAGWLADGAYTWVRLLAANGAVTVELRE
jgi:alpha-glucosidase (family GH31 glycosyl hydrolase)